MAARFSPNMWDGPPHVPISFTLWRIDHSLQQRAKKKREDVNWISPDSLLRTRCWTHVPERLQVAVAVDGVPSQVQAR